MKKQLIFYTFLIIAFVISGCTAESPPTLLPIETIIAGTQGAAMAETELAIPFESVTPSPTFTRVPTLTPYPSATDVILTATFTPIPVTPTNITSGEGDVLYACELVELSPGDDYFIRPNGKFNWTWRVRNIGTKEWETGTMFAQYARGSAFHTKNRFPLENSADVGEVGVFHIKMKAPEKEGTYTTTFSLKKGVHYFCYYSLRIVVRK